MIIAVEWDVKHQIKQVFSKFEQLFYGYFCGNICFVLDMGIFLGQRFYKQCLTHFESQQAVAQQFYYDYDISFRWTESLYM